MTIVGHMALLGWIPVVLVLFTVLPPRRAVIAAFLLAWLFLPMAGYRFEGLPNYTKMSATSVGVMLGIMLFDLGRLLSFRPRWFDLSIATWCIIPLFTSLSNDLGAYDGVSALLDATIIWGLPYLIGRLYFSDPAGLRELAVGIFIGGLVYIPFCLYEIRMSPQLHRMVYGYHAHAFIQTFRFGGWRPTVFMQHGLMVGMWMTGASLVGIWLWKTGALKRLWGIPTVWLLVPLLITTVLVKSALAMLLLVVGLAALFAVSWTRLTIPILVLVMIPPLYIAGRTAGTVSGDNLVTVADYIFGEDRAGSLEFRLHHENVLAERALERPLLGWGGWGRSRVIDETGRDRSITDSLWIITLGRNGVAGVTALLLVVLLPVVLLWRHHPAGHWSHPAVAPAAALAMLLILYMLDNLLNAMVNPIYMLAAGGIMAVDATVKELRQRQARPGAIPAAHQPPALASAPVTANRMIHH